MNSGPRSKDHILLISPEGTRSNCTIHTAGTPTMQLCSDRHRPYQYGSFHAYTQSLRRIMDDRTKNGMQPAHLRQGPIGSRLPTSGRRHQAIGYSGTWWGAAASGSRVFRWTCEGQQWSTDISEISKCGRFDKVIGYYLWQKLSRTLRQLSLACDLCSGNMPS